MSRMKKGRETARSALAAVCAFALAATAAADDLTMQVSLADGDVNVEISDSGSGMIDKIAGLYLVWDVEDQGNNILSWAHRLQYDGEISASGTYTFSSPGIPSGYAYRVIAAPAVQLLDGCVSLTGTQYIDTGADASALKGIDVKFKYTGHNSGTGYILGGKAGSFDIHRDSSDTAFIVYHRAVDYPLYIPSSFWDSPHEFAIMDANAKFDGATIPYINSSATWDGQSVTLKRNGGDRPEIIGGYFSGSTSAATILLGDAWTTPGSVASGKNVNADWYHAAFYSKKDLSLVADFIPAITNGTATLYDTVSGRCAPKYGTAADGAAECSGQVTNLIGCSVIAYCGKRATWIGTGESPDVTSAANWEFTLDGEPVADTLPDAETVVVVTNLNFDLDGTKSLEFSEIIFEGCALSQNRDLKGLAVRPEIVEVEYINAPKGSYVDTGFKPNQYTHVMMDVTVQSINENWFGVHADSSKIDNANYFSSTNKFIMCNDGDMADGNYVGGIFTGYGNNGATSTRSNPAIGSGKKRGEYTDLGFGRYTVDFDKGHGTITKADGSGSAYDKTRDANTFQMEYNMYLFAVNAAGAAATRTTQGTIRCHACKIWDNGVLIRDYVPAKRGEEYGLYDRASGEFAEMSGNGGDFSGGAATGVTLVPARTAVFDIDLAGHNLSVSNVFGASSGTITDTVGGGELHVAIRKGYRAVNSAVSFTGSMRLVKEGDGDFFAAKAGQAYTGGTEAVANGGRLVSDVMSAPWGAEGSLITVRDGASFDWAGQISNAGTAYSFAIAGAGPDGNGALVNSVAGPYVNSTSATWIYSKIIDDLTLLDDATVGGYGYFGLKHSGNDNDGSFSHTLTMNGNTLTINMQGTAGNIASGFNVFVFTCVKSVGSGSIVFNAVGDVDVSASFVTGGSDLGTVDFTLSEGAFIYDRMPVTFRSFVNNSANAPKVYDSAFTILDAYKPMTTNHLMKVVLGDATHLSPVLDLSGLDDAFTLPASKYTLGAAEGATVMVKLGDRKCSPQEPVVCWTTAPSGVVFAKGDEGRGYSLVSKSDGLYAQSGLMVIFR